MKKKVLLVLTNLLLISVLKSSMVMATLIDRGGGLIYDTDLDITWMQDANYSLTSGYHVNPFGTGIMQWSDAMAFADALEYYDPVRNITWDDWRLPTAVNSDGSGPDAGYGLAGSELGHLYYDELNNSGWPTDPAWINKGPFINVSSGTYFTSTLYEADPRYVWGFWTGGYSGHGWGSSGQCMSVWVVRDGDIFASVPEPATIFLLSIGLTGLAGIRRRKIRKYQQ